MFYTSVKIFLAFIIIITVNISCRNNNESPIANITGGDLSNNGLITNLHTGCAYNKTTTSHKINITNPEAREIEQISRIVSYTGIPMNFKIYAANIENAIATIIDNNRYIIFDPNLLRSIDYASNSYWSSMSILAHEVGHHLSGHTFTTYNNPHLIELEADKYSGFILYKLGATLEQAQSAINTLAPLVSTSTHPGRSERLVAIKQGWNEANTTRYQGAIPPPPAETFISEWEKDIHEFSYSTEYLLNEDFATAPHWDLFEIPCQYKYLGIILEQEGTFPDCRYYVMIKESNGWLEKQSKSWLYLNNLHEAKKYMSRVGLSQFREIMQVGSEIHFDMVAYGNAPVLYFKCIKYIPIKFRNKNSIDSGTQPQVSQNIATNHKEIISSFLLAEEEQIFNKIYEFFSDKMKRYYDIYNPNYMELLATYKRSWSKISDPSNDVIDIKNVSTNTYDVNLNFSFQLLSNGTHKSHRSTVRFVFDKNGKILETYAL